MGFFKHFYTIQLESTLASIPQKELTNIIRRASSANTLQRIETKSISKNRRGLVCWLIKRKARVRVQGQTLKQNTKSIFFGDFLSADFCQKL